jgi:hypothetical protein
VRIAPISAAIAGEVAALPKSIHQDPADRLIVATCRVRKLPLLTKDRLIMARDWWRSGSLDQGIRGWVSRFQRRIGSSSKWAAERGMILTMHWTRDASVDELLTVRKLNREVPITGLRWSIAHLNDASEKTMSVMETPWGWDVSLIVHFTTATACCSMANARVAVT